MARQAQRHQPRDVVAEYGADVLRCTRFMGEFELPKPWTRAIEGCYRSSSAYGAWSRIRRKAGAAIRSAPAPQDIKKVTGDLDRMAFNTAVAAMMEYLNELQSNGAPARTC